MTDWVSSTGGPLICIEKRLADTWRGIDGLSAPGRGVVNDYERACQVRTFTTTIPLEDGSSALVLGDQAMDTIVRIKSGQVFMLRVAACEDDFDGDHVLEHLDPSLFSKADEEMIFAFRSSPLVLFDSSCPFVEAETYCEFSIKPGAYNVLTRYLKNDLYWIAAHRFDPII